MSDASTKTMINAYNSQAEPSMFLTSQFQAPRANFYNSESVELDIQRSGEDVAIVIVNMAEGYRKNSADIYTNKEFTAPVFKELAPLNAYSLLRREFGQNPFANNDFQRKATTKSFSLMRKMENKIRRSIELMASQVLQTATVDMIDDNGATLFTVDFKPKATHFPTAGTIWSDSGADPLGDLGALAEIIRNDGLMDSNQLYFGIDAWNAFAAHPTVQAQMDLLRLNIGSIGPMNPAQSGTRGAQFRGTIDIGHNKFDMWTYGARYTHPQTGAATPFIDPAKVIMKSNDTRLDATYGSIPKFRQNNADSLRFMPGRITNRDARVDFFPNSWVTEDGQTLNVSISARPLLIPTAIDTFGCIATGV